MIHIQFARLPKDGEQDMCSNDYDDPSRDDKGDRGDEVR